MTKREFILDTLLPYLKGERPFGMNGQQCTYLDTEGNRCSVGYHIEDMTKILDEYGEVFEGSVSELLNHYGTGILTQEAQDQDLSIAEWSFIQSLHDSLALENTEQEHLTYLGYLEQFTELEFPELREVIMSKD